MRTALRAATALWWIRDLAVAVVMRALFWDLLALLLAGIVLHALWRRSRPRAGITLSKDAPGRPPWARKDLLGLAAVTGAGLVFTHLIR
ncbi:hypothetical protein [Streptomyces sp. NPDC048603]|uniref:hypothetical protein n=1 Tax=Streptomyces sp. NPDC048603 TaxID=3365577 RepID=UPI003713C121